MCFTQNEEESPDALNVQNSLEPTEKNQEDSELMPGLIEMNFIPATDAFANQDDKAQEDAEMIEQTGIAIDQHPSTSDKKSPSDKMGVPPKGKAVSIAVPPMVHPDKDQEKETNIVTDNNSKVIVSF